MLVCFHTLAIMEVKRVVLWLRIVRSVVLGERQCQPDLRPTMLLRTQQPSA